jgi:hypothetical protein
MSVTFYKIPEGYRVYKGRTSTFQGFLLGILTTNQHNLGGKTDKPLTNEEAEHFHKKGGVVYQPMEAEHWTLHFTSPQVNVEDLKEILSSLPKAASDHPAGANSDEVNAVA